MEGGIESILSTMYFLVVEPTELNLVSTLFGVHFGTAGVTHTSVWQVELNDPS